MGEHADDAIDYFLFGRKRHFRRIEKNDSYELRNFVIDKIIKQTDKAYLILILNTKNPVWIPKKGTLLYKEHDDKTNKETTLVSVPRWLADIKWKESNVDIKN